MTAATTKIERSGPAIRTALAELAPDECAQVEAEFQRANGGDVTGLLLRDEHGNWVRL